MADSTSTRTDSPLLRYLTLDQLDEIILSFLPHKYTPGLPGLTRGEKLERVRILGTYDTAVPQWFFEQNAHKFDHTFCVWAYEGPGGIQDGPLWEHEMDNRIVTELESRGPLQFDKRTLFLCRALPQYRVKQWAVTAIPHSVTEKFRILNQAMEQVQTHLKRCGILPSVAA